MDDTALNKVWLSLADLTAEATRMTEAEASRFVSNPVAKLVGLLPFLADCGEPRRTALDAYNPFGAGVWTSETLAKLGAPVIAAGSDGARAALLSVSVAEGLDATLSVETALLGTWGN